MFWKLLNVLFIRYFNSLCYIMHQRASISWLLSRLRKMKIKHMRIIRMLVEHMFHGGEITPLSERPVWRRRTLTNQSNVNERAASWEGYALYSFSFLISYHLCCSVLNPLYLVNIPSMVRGQTLYCKLHVGVPMSEVHNERMISLALWWILLDIQPRLLKAFR